MTPSLGHGLAGRGPNHRHLRAGRAAGRVVDRLRQATVTVDHRAFLPRHEPSAMPIRYELLACALAAHQVVGHDAEALRPEDDLAVATPEPAGAGTGACAATGGSPFRYRGPPPVRFPRPHRRRRTVARPDAAWPVRASADRGRPGAAHRGSRPLAAAVVWFVPHRERLDTVLVDVLDTAQDSLSGRPGIGPDTDAEPVHRPGIDLVVATADPPVRAGSAPGDRMSGGVVAHPPDRVASHSKRRASIGRRRAARLAG